MQLTRQIKFWLIIALIHASVIYALSRAGAVEIVRTIVTASVVSSELPAFTKDLQTPSSKDTAVDTQTTAAQKSITRTAHQSHDKVSATASVRDNGVHSTQPKPAANAANPLALTPSLSTSSNNKADDHASITFTAPTHIGGYLHNPKPPYPAFSKDAGEEGAVTLSAMIEVNGRPSSVDVVKSSGYSRLDRSARDTVLNQYRFTPATQNGQAIPYRYRFEIHFKLNKN